MLPSCWTRLRRGGGRREWRRMRVGGETKGGGRVCRGLQYNDPCVLQWETELSAFCVSEGEGEGRVMRIITDAWGV